MSWAKMLETPQKSTPTQEYHQSSPAQLLQCDNARRDSAAVDMITRPLWSGDTAVGTLNPAAGAPNKEIRLKGRLPGKPTIDTNQMACNQPTSLMLWSMGFVAVLQLVYLKFWRVRKPCKTEHATADTQAAPVQLISRETAVKSVLSG